ncbi:L,D-transpeptidase [Corynebacterium mayonis]|uniref:L,D-transpeptidase n=1 Tax=Corynebacterium mayonis TaxID=3062461 RepID=UPI003140BE55
MKKVRVLRKAAAVVVAMWMCAVGVACTQPNASLSSDAAIQEVAQESEKLQPPVISIADGETDVAPGEPVTVEASAGLRALILTNDAGKRVAGEFNEGMSKWTTTEPLGYGRTYTFEGVDREGNEIDTSFSTVVPVAQTTGYFGPVEGSIVGVGQAVTVRFSTAPPDRAAVEEAISVQTSNNTEGGFYWIDPYELRWRPKDYWQPGTSVTVKADLYGRDLGGGVYGAKDVETSFTIGDEVITRIDNATKTLTVVRNGEAVYSFPVSLGTDGKWDTPNGIYVVGDQHNALTMDSRTYGLSLDAGGYVTDVKSATQLSYSGIYVHSAPWAMWALGGTNQSHGCINASPDNAAWYLNNVKRGDPVEISNTYGGTLSGTDGLGYWNIPWEQWKDGNPNLK